MRGLTWLTKWCQKCGMLYILASRIRTQSLGKKEDVREQKKKKRKPESKENEEN